MKYVIIIALIAVILRIDVLMRLFDRASDKLNKETPDVSSYNPEDAESSLAPQTIYLSSKDRFISILRSFRDSPDGATRAEAMSVFKSHPTLFTEKLDPELESAIFEWRDLVIQGSKEVPLILLDLSTILKGENLETVNKMFAILMDHNLDLFLDSYTKTKDQNCMIATLVGDFIPDEEKINELFDREKALNDYLLREKVDPKLSAYVNNCLLVLRLHLAKVAPAPAVEPPTENTTPTDTPEEAAP